jgi:hypothetical protein
MWRQHKSSNEEDRRITPHVLEIKLVFECHNLDPDDQRVLNDNSIHMKTIGSMINKTFQDCLLIAEDDPERGVITVLNRLNLIKLSTVSDTGEENFAKMISDMIGSHLDSTGLRSRVTIRTVELGQRDGTKYIFVT